MTTIVQKINSNKLLEKVMKNTFEKPGDLDTSMIEILVRRGVPYKGMYHPMEDGKAQIYLNKMLRLKEKEATLQHELVHWYLHDIVKEKQYKDGDKEFDSMLAAVQSGKLIKAKKDTSKSKKKDEEESGESESEEEPKKTTKSRKTTAKKSEDKEDE